MARKIIGLDIGHHSIKAVLLRETLRGIDLAGFYERPIADRDPAHLSAAIKGLFRENHLRADTLVASLPGNHLSVHQITLPFGDPKKLEQILPFEIESLIPFPIEEVIVDHFPMGPSNGTPANGAYPLCAGIVRKEFLHQYLGILRGASLDPTIIEHDALALCHTFVHFSKERTGPVALLDVGAGKTNLCVVSDGKARVVRTFARGGDRVTQAIGEALGLSYSEAENKKRTLSGPVRILEEEEETRKIAAAIQETVRPISEDLFQTLHAFQTASGESVSTLYITGGGSRLTMMRELLASDLHLDVQPWTVPAALELDFRHPPEMKDTALPGIGLALRGLRRDREGGFNFRKGEFFVRKEVQEVQGRMITLGAIFMAAVLLGILSFYVRLQDRESEYRQVKQEIRKAYLETFPGSKNVVDENQQMKSAVADLRKKVEALGGTVNAGVSPLDILKGITESVPKELQIETQDFAIDRGRVRIQGSTDSFDAADRIKKDLEGLPFLRKVEISDAKLSADQKKVNFRIAAELL